MSRRARARSSWPSRCSRSRRSPSAPSPTPSALPPIKIAVEAPLTGSQSSNGLDMLRGVQLAVRRGQRRQGGARPPGQDRQGRRQGRQRERQAGRAARDQEERRRGDRPLQLLGRDRQPPDLPEEPGRAGAPDLLRRHAGARASRSSRRTARSRRSRRPTCARRAPRRSRCWSTTRRTARSRSGWRTACRSAWRPTASPSPASRSRSWPTRWRPATTRRRSPRRSRPNRICSTSARTSRRAPRSPRRSTAAGTAPKCLMGLANVDPGFVSARRPGAQPALRLQRRAGRAAAALGEEVRAPVPQGLQAGAGRVGRVHLRLREDPLRGDREGRWHRVRAPAEEAEAHEGLSRADRHDHDRPGDRLPA